MAEITVRDLLSWERRIDLAPSIFGSNGSADADTSLRREVTWAVTLRASMPILPPLRGGELVILPDRILADAGVPVEEIVREVASRGATGLIVERTIDAPPSMVMLWSESIPADLESDINRMLTEQRGEIYRLGTELGRILTQLNAMGADLDQVLRTSAEHIGSESVVVSGRGGLTGSSNPEMSADEQDLSLLDGLDGWQGERYGVRLSGANTLWLGPVPPDRRAMARLLSERIGMAVESAMAHALDVRPRGSARAQAIAGLLTETGAETAKMAAALGLPSNGVFQVALASAGSNRLQMQRDLAAFGSVHDAADVDGYAAALIESPNRSGRSIQSLNGGGSDPRFLPAEVTGQTTWIAVSAMVNGVVSIPSAARQARFLASLISTGMVSGSVVRYDRPSDVGIFRLLFPLWGSGELEAFARDTLGDLAVRDKRGALRKTLLAYLEAGGSQVDAATSLGVHRNTLAYRLKQIAELTGIDPVKPQSHLALHMALLASVLPPAPGLVGQAS
ncbi:PucR family transcriptional regulator [soil metagenome]